jgi:GNAT superfamily N-acetyltransferase
MLLSKRCMPRLGPPARHPDLVIPGMNSVHMSAPPSSPSYELVSDPARFDIDAIHAFLTRSYWSPGIPRGVVQRAVAHSICIGVLHDGQQVAFARMVSDRATFAYLGDVYVLEAHRGRGLARRMMEALLAHPDLQGLRRMLLVTRDAHALYARFGFTPLAAPERFMERHRADAYARAESST